MQCNILRRKLLVSGFYPSAYPSFSIVKFLKSSRLKKLLPILLSVSKFFVEGMELLRELYHVLLAVAFLVSSTLGAKDKELYCGVCHVIADELQWEISQVDPRKMLEIESFRVDPKGNQKTRKIQYARSETHLIEQLDSMCEKMNNYAESSDPATGKKSYIRTSSRNGEAVTLSNVAISGDIAKKLKHACESIIEDYDDDIIATFKKERKDPKKYMCRTTTGLCIDDDDDEFSESDYDDDNDDGNNEDDATDHDEL